MIVTKPANFAHPLKFTLAHDGTRCIGVGERDWENVDRA